MYAFADRREAGRALGGAVAAYLAGRSDVESTPVVLGLPRGGVPVADEVAAALGASLDVLLVRKLGVPGHEELAFGAVGEDGVSVRNAQVVTAAHLSDGTIERVQRREREVIRDRRDGLAAVRRPVALTGRDVVIVDDGLATGATMRAAVEVAAAHGAREIMVAVPVAPTDTLDLFDRTICVLAVSSGSFGGVGRFYRDFRPTTDAEVSGVMASHAGA
jgi:predicted phosphoribosyltransferase